MNQKVVAARMFDCVVFNTEKQETNHIFNDRLLRLILNGKKMRWIYRALSWVFVIRKCQLEKQKTSVSAWIKNKWKDIQ